jgi:hypothetical protein
VKFWPDERVPSGKKHCDGIPNIDSDYFVEGDLRSRRIKRKSGHEEVLGWLVGWLVGWRFRPAGLCDCASIRRGIVGSYSDTRGNKR